MKTSRVLKNLVFTPSRSLALFLRNTSGPEIEFEPAETVLAYRHVCDRIEEINEHELFRVSGKIVGIGIDETFLGVKISVKEAFTKI